MPQGFPAGAGLAEVFEYQPAVITYGFQGGQKLFEIDYAILQWRPAGLPDPAGLGPGEGGIL
jgi:hypothetical protein